MQQPQREKVTLEDIVINKELSGQTPRRANLLSENQALHTLARQLVNQPEIIPQIAVDIALELCDCGTAGVSLLEVLPNGEEIFRCNVLAGALEQFVSGTTPRDFSPCGVCLERGAPVLFSHPERYFTYFQEVKTPVIEGLVLPLIADDRAFGTIWILSHDEHRHFDTEDVRLMTSLADFTTAALLLNQRQTDQLLVKNTQLEALVVERKRAEAALRESEERLRVMIENLPGGAAFIVDRNLRYLLAEGEALYTAGFKPEDLVGKTIFDALAPELAAEYEEIYRSALAGKSFAREHNAHDRSYISRGTPLRSPNGEVYAVLAVSYDITDRKQAEEQLRRAAEIDAFRVALSDALRSLQCANEIQSVASRVLGEHLQVDRVYYSEVEPDNEHIVNPHDYYTNGKVASIAGRYQIRDYGTFVFREIQANRTVIVADTQTISEDSEAERAGYSAISVRAFIAYPLVKAGRLVALLGVTQSTPRIWTDQEVELVRETAERTWAAVERARAEAALRESEDQFRRFVTASSDTIYKMSADWSEIYSLVGKEFIASTEIPSRTWLQEYIPEEDQPGVWAAIQEAIRTKSTFELEHRVIRLEGTIGWTFSRAIPVLNARGEVIEWFGAASDVTDRKLAEANRIQLIQEQAAREEERQRAEALAELDRTKTVFFSNVSHEFRTPLTLILAPLQDALSDLVNPLAPPQRERLELAHRNGLRLLKLVNILLDFSRIEAGRMGAVYEATDLALLTNELASVFRSAIERAGLRLTVDCPPLPEPVYVDQQMWEKIVLNLLSNAFKFTLEGEIAVRLYIADRHYVTLQVEDTGTGIEPEELPHLFERFYQVPKAKGRTHEGSGIGLALVQELIKMHGGTVDVSSTVGMGSCFTVTIPLGTAHLPSERIQATRTLTSTVLGAAPYVREAERWIPQEGNGEKFTPTPYSLLPTPQVLLVDDNADMRDYLKRILSEYVKVEAVANGAAALAAVTETVPDLIVSDVMMPQMDGFELLKALRADQRTREVPIILLSARAGVESAIEGLQALADDYLIKPFSARELVTRVLAHLQMAQLRSQALRQEKIISRRKDKFLAEVSHELNTPLVAILGWTRLLRSSPPNQSMLCKSLETIERNATLQAKLISDLLDISRITAGKLHLNLQPVELQSAIKTAIATVRQSLETKDIKLNNLLVLRPIIIQGDPDRLQQIVLNLLTNAVKFTPIGGRIEVRLDVTETQAQIVVSDTGCGIAVEFLPYVFDSFRQAESSNSTKGLGLGLAIARHLVELHNGIISAESPGVGQGATFTIHLPLVSVSI
ncbi:PAS domain-containing protein [Scytonema sp. UIC 10036]|uniref:ATP-binding protein n=1 Tax=Scytonema sp. UIC 10036 TaxID=2304196 RepID=UPI0012DA341C|nr:ATP-binding protein [Scytonema sp. UIC 10036]MUG98547.1 PAS domain-containing protein [Scytonema sp. UIC 10036]